MPVILLDDFVSDAAWRKTVVGDRQHTGRPTRLAALAGFAFYEHARQAFAIVATGKSRFYDNLPLRKGIIRPAEANR